VLIHSLAIADSVGLTDQERESLRYAAMWHDMGRTNDGVDYFHGAKSAGKVVGLGLHEGIEPYVLEAALFAVTHHCGSEEHAERAIDRMREPESMRRVFRVLKDADGLDRVRLGSGDLNPSYLRYEVSRTMVDRAWELLAEIA
jgi:hypothetical protein